MSGAWWTCCRCGDPIDGDPHEDPDPPEGTDGDVCEACCPVCTDPAHVPALIRPWVEPVTLGGHPGPTQDQAARAEKAATA